MGTDIVPIFWEMLIIFRRIAESGRPSLWGLLLGLLWIFGFTVFRIVLPFISMYSQEMSFSTNVGSSQIYAIFKEQNGQFTHPPWLIINSAALSSISRTE